MISRWHWVYTLQVLEKPHLNNLVNSILKDEPKSKRIQELIAEIRAMWDEWDLRDGQKDDELEFDAFYNGFMAPYFGCYR